MDLQKNWNFQIGFVLVMLSVGVKLLDDMVDMGLFLVIVYGLMALIGVIFMIKGILEVKKTEH